MKKIFAFVALMLSGCHIVESGHVGVWKKWGAVQPTAYPEGLYPTMPIQSFWYDYPTRVQKLEVPAASSSKDLQNITAEIALNYKIDSTKAPMIYQKIGTIESLEENIIRPLLQESIKKSTARYTAEELITRRPEVKADIRNYIQERLNQSFIVVTELSVNDFRFSDNFNDAIEAKVKAEQDALKAKNELRRVEFEARQAEARAEGEANALLRKAEAEAEAQRILARSITPKVLQLKALEKWDGDLPVVATEDGTFVDIAAVLKAKKSNQ